MAFTAWGRSFSVDLRAPALMADTQICVKAKRVASLHGNEDGLIRKVSLGARSADVGDVAIGDELMFTLFDDVAVTLALKKKMPSPLGGDVFLAEASGYKGVKNAVVIRTDEGLTVDIQDYFNKKVYKVISTATGVAVQEMEANDGACGCDALKPTELPGMASKRPRKAKKVVATKNEVSSEEVFVDILVAYDNGAATWASANGGGITNFAQMAVQKMNTVLANNGLDDDFRFRLVGVSSVAASSADLDYVLEAATYAYVGWESIQAARDEVGADIVTVLIDTGTDDGTTGLGWSLEADNLASFSESAYNCCAIRSVAQSHTMTHEVGHNMGCGHSDLQTIQPGPQFYSDSAGYYFSADGEKYHTVMAYDGEGPGGIEVPYFSSPNHAYLGAMVGDDTHNNTRTLANTFAAASTWREFKGEEIGEGEEIPLEPLEWLTVRTKVFSKAKAEGKLVFMLYGDDTCGFSEALKNGSCENYTVKDMLERSFVCWYCTDYYDAYEYLDDAGTPQIAIIDPDSPKEWLFYAGGYQSAEELLLLLTKATHENEVSILVNGYTWTANIIGEGAFLTSVSPCPKGDIKIPSAIGSYAITGFDVDFFRDNDSLTSIVIPESILKLPRCAFWDCCNLTNVTVPASVVEIVGNPFIGCSPRIQVKVSPDNLKYCAMGDVVCEKDSMRAVLGIDRTTVTIPDGVIEIGDDAFWGCRNLTAVTITGSVKYIGQWAFGGNQNLNRVIIEEGVEKIGFAAFEGCGVADIVIPDSVRIIDCRAFACSGLEQIVIPENAEVKDLVFWDAQKLKDAYLPKRLEGKLPVDVFKGCSDVTVHYYEGILAVVEFDSNDGEVCEYKRKLPRGATVGFLPTLSRPGYTFNGWFTAKSGGTRVTVATEIPGDVTYYAQWEKIVVPEPDPVVVPGLHDDDGVAIESPVPTNAASEYNGYLYDAKNGVMKGTIQVKVGKPGKKDGKVSAKATIMVGTKKVTLKAADNGKAVINPDGPTYIALVGGEVCEITLDAEGLLGYYGAYNIAGLRNLLASKDKSEANAAGEEIAKWVGALAVRWNGGTASVTIDKKGKAKVSIVLSNGTKGTSTTQLLMGDEWHCVPVMVTKKMSVSFTLWLSADGSEALVSGLGDDAVVGKTGNLKFGAKFNVDADDGLWAKVSPDLLTFALTHDVNLVFGAVDHGTGHMLAGTTVDDDVYDVLVAFVDLFRISEIASHFVLFVDNRGGHDGIA